MSTRKSHIPALVPRFSENVKAEPVNWDAYFLYGPDATWTATPDGRLRPSPVFESDARSELKSGLEPLARR